jgi:hypothetical protein
MYCHMSGGVRDLQTGFGVMTGFIAHLYNFLTTIHIMPSHLIIFDCRLLLDPNCRLTAHLELRNSTNDSQLNSSL